MITPYHLDGRLPVYGETMRTYRNRRRTTYFKVQTYDRTSLTWRDLYRNGFDCQDQAVHYLEENAVDGEYRILKYSPAGVQPLEWPPAGQKDSD